MTIGHALFQYERYSAFLRDCESRFGVRTMRDHRGEPGVILRHDIDLDLRPAARLADIEEAAGVRSTMYVLLSCPLYNVFSRENRAILRDLCARGFEIALHFDPLVYGDEVASNGAELARLAMDEAVLLGGVIGEEITTYSLHNPSVSGMMQLDIPLRSAYDTTVFGPDRYLSDSQRVFKSDPFTFIERAADGAVQLNLHPLHFSEDGAGYDHSMSGYVIETIDAVVRNFSMNQTFLREAGERLPDLVARRISGGDA